MTPRKEGRLAASKRTPRRADRRAALPPSARAPSFTSTPVKTAASCWPRWGARRSPARSAAERRRRRRSPGLRAERRPSTLAAESAATPCFTRSAPAGWAWSLRPTIPSSIAASPSAGSSRGLCGRPARGGRFTADAEAQALARLSHPHVITVFDAGRFDEQVFLTMEFIEGGTLGQWLRAEARSPEAALKLLLEAGRGSPPRTPPA